MNLTPKQPAMYSMSQLKRWLFLLKLVRDNNLNMLINTVSTCAYQLFSVAGDYCLNFAYSMFGRETGSLNVYYKDESSGEQSLIWSLTGEQGEGWAVGSVNMNFRQGLKVTFSNLSGTIAKFSSTLYSKAACNWLTGFPIQPSVQQGVRFMRLISMWKCL